MTENVKKEPRVNALVKLDPELENIHDYQHLAGKTFLFMGEIANMPGHGIYLNVKTHRFEIGYHTDDFVELSEEET